MKVTVNESILHEISAIKYYKKTLKVHIQINTLEEKENQAEMLRESNDVLSNKNVSLEIS